MSNRMQIPAGPPVLSVTFDDVIGSACDNGARLLEAYGGRGTFYVAGALTGGQEDDKAAHTMEQLGDLCRAGHEIGSHGWAHRDYTAMRRDELRLDLGRNTRFLTTLTGRAAVNFAYPFGRYDRQTQLQCVPRFQSCRILGDGIYRKHVDLSRLGSLRFYGAELALAAWREALRQIADGGWLIVNTHAVEDDCGEYGCRAGDLEALLHEARAIGCDLLPVEDMINRSRRSLAGPG
ncbi:MAG: polysaccharide deacetylase family protein [Pigmentiphaga sp.]